MTTGNLTAATKRGHRLRARRASLPVLSLYGALLAYVGVLFWASVFLVVTWRFPESRPSTYEGVETLGWAMTFVNALWGALVVVKLVEVLRGPRLLRRSRAVPLLVALVVVVLLQRFAFLVLDVAHW